MDLKELRSDLFTENERITKMGKIICLLLGYTFGLFQTGYIYGKMNGIDIRQHGSGNAGTTNALRTMGAKAGIITLVGDALKCILAVALVRMIFAERQADMLPLLGLYAGFGAVLGHNYPFYLKFKGGKGIAATFGLILATDFNMAVVCALVFFIILGITRYVSVGSLVLSVTFFVQLVVLGQMGHFGMTQNLLLEMYGIGLLFVISAFFQHRANIERLKNGTENKFSIKKKEK